MNAANIIDILICNATGQTSVNFINTGTITHSGNNGGNIYNNITDASFSRLARFLDEYCVKTHEYDYRPSFNRQSLTYKVI